MKSRILFSLLFISILLGCEKDELSSFSYIRDFSFTSIATDTLIDAEVLDSVFHVYQNRCYYQVSKTGALGKTLHMFGSGNKWRQEIRSIGAPKFIDATVQIENIIGNLILLDAGEGVLEQSISPVSQSDFEYAFNYGDSVFSVFRESDRCVLGSREATGNAYTEVASIPDNLTPVEPTELAFYESNNQAFAIWYCEAMGSGNTAYWIVKRLSANGGFWLFQVQSGSENHEPFIAGQTFYYIKAPNLLSAYSLSGDSLLWERDEFRGRPVGINNSYLYSINAGDLEVRNRRNANVVHTASGIGANYFYEEAYILNLLPDELRILDPKNLRELKTFPNDLEFLSSMGSGRYVFSDPGAPADTTFLHLIGISPK